MKRDRTCPVCGPRTPLTYLHQRTILGNRYLYHCSQCDTNWTLPFKGDAAQVIAEQLAQIAALKRQVEAGEALRFELATLCDLLDLDSTAKINRNWQLQVRKHLAAWDAAKEGSHE